MAEDGPRLEGETVKAWLYRTFPTRFDNSHDRIVGMYAYDRGFEEGRAYERHTPDVPAADDTKPQPTTVTAPPETVPVSDSGSTSITTLASRETTA